MGNKIVHIAAIITFKLCFLALDSSIMDLAFHVNTISRTAARFKKSSEVNQISSASFLSKKDTNFIKSL